jgi:hypothetical protein
MPACPHPEFRAPADPNVKIWRYMDFAKFVALLDSSNLFFSRSDLLGDPFEGSISSVTAKFRASRNEASSLGIEEHNIRISRWYRQSIFVNCWHMSNHESVAMWKLYSKSNEAISIQSTYKDLFNELPNNVYLGTVRYANYLNELIPDANMFCRFLHKRQSFQHEQEIRAVIWDKDRENYPTYSYLPGDQDNAPIITVTKGQENTELGKSIPISVDNLIENIYVAPTAPTWFLDVVKSIVHKYVPLKPVLQSTIDVEPIF